MQRRKEGHVLADFISPIFIDMIHPTMYCARIALIAIAKKPGQPANFLCCPDQKF